MSPESSEVSGDPLERITSPYPIVRDFEPPRTPLIVSPTLPITSNHVTSNHGEEQINREEEALNKLNEAARRIAQVAQVERQANQKERRLPRASRLAPIHDISADIQRHSTPMPTVPGSPGSAQMPAVDLPQNFPNGRQNQQSQPEKDLSGHVPDLWPWLHDSEADENDIDQWSTDPLLLRRFPNSAESANIEEEDLRRAIAEGLVTLPEFPRRARKRSSRGIRIVFYALAILPAVALSLDSILVFFAFVHPHHPAAIADGPPSLTLSTNVASIGQTVMVHIAHFSSDKQVYLTYDIEQPVQLTNGSPLVKVSATGDANVSMLVDQSWGPGFHTIEAEGLTSRYTASATLQVINSGPTRPSHLLLPVSSLDFGAGYVGANTIQSLTLRNSGGGAISWAASSNQSWLLLSPTSGMFSASQTIAVAVQRANLQPGDNYSGKITFSSNVGGDESVTVHMAVRALPLNAGPVLVVTPPVLSFTAYDGEASPSDQTLVISDPGSQPLDWSIVSNNPVFLSSQSLFIHALDPKTSWLSIDTPSGVVVPHGTNTIHALVDSRNLLPGLYTDVLTFSSSHNALNNPQSVSVSLTILPRCGLTMDAGSMSFTAVSGQNNPSNQSLTLKATSSCGGFLNWKAVSNASWLSVTPASGQLKGSASTVTSVGVNASILKPATYLGEISFIAAQSTQTVAVQLTVQPPPPPSAPILGAAPLSLNFSTTQGMPNPPGQVVTITNTGGSPLIWRTQVNGLASMWLGAGPTGGTIPAKSTGQVTVNINIANLTPTTYVGQVVLFGTDTNGNTASGSPQTITVNLLVLPPCTLQQPSLSSLAFTATQGMPNPGSQSEMITASGNCNWPMTWNATVAGGTPSWLSFTPTNGTIPASGQSSTIVVSVNIAGLQPNTYSAPISIAATDGANNVQGSPQSFTVNLTVLQPCTLSLQTPTGGFSFNSQQGQPSPAGQTFTLGETGNCLYPVSWTATGDSGSTGWLVISPTLGSDKGGGATVSVSVNSQSLSIGTYSGIITVTATGSGGATVLNSPQTINVALTVAGYSISGTVIACSDSNCTTSQPLPNAALSLLNNSTNQTTPATADGSGNYTFPNNLPLGSYTLTVNGTIGTTNYSGTQMITLSGNMTNNIVNTFPAS